MAIASGEITVPKNVDKATLYNAVFSGPVMPWIDPVKEANAWKILLRGGAATESEWVRARGANPDDVKRRRKAELTRTVNRGWCLIPTRQMTKETPVSRKQNRVKNRPKAQAKNSWFRMQASSENEAEIYIYDEIGYWGVTAKQFVANLKALGDVTHINLHINSPGGDVFDGIAIFNALKFHGAAITVYIDGLAASMASVIAMVGNPVIMPENTMMMIHKPWGFAGGDADDMRDYADLLDKVESVLIPAYAQKTGKSTEEIAAMLEDETWMDGTNVSSWVLLTRSHHPCRQWPVSIRNVLRNLKRCQTAFAT
jgi:ATP-dependent Clp endopeptidase proteolytic subunit ClpP